jgi:DNA topoisomerase III
VVRWLLQQASDVVIATDADREGEMIAREVLEACSWQRAHRFSGCGSRRWMMQACGRRYRTLWPGAKTDPLHRAATSRARADWLVGMNLTRAYTVLGRAAGHDGVLSVGRVQTPTLRLVVDRDRAIAAFVPQPYWDLRVVH